MTQNVRLQNLRDFTVQIRNADDQIVGTGIAVSTDGKIVTCAHVVEAALGAHPRNANGAEVGVYFPQARGGEEKKRKAVVEKFFPDNDDDVVLLQLTSGASPLAPEQIAIVGTADESATHAFRSYGYRALGTYPAGWADGTIMGSVDSPPKLALHVDPVQLDSKQIAPGMSGSGVLDVERNLLIGIISETYYPPSDDPKDRDTAWSVNARVLSIPPLELNVQDASLALKAAPEPKFDKEQAEAAVFIKEKYSWNNAPSVLAEWTGRDHLLQQITDDWNNPQKHVVGLIGFGGEGKSSLARKWVDSVIASTEGAKQSPRESEIASGSALAMTKLDGVFWWGFYENRSVDEFLEAALKYMSGGRIDPRAVPSSNLRAQIIGAMLGAGRYLFVLDGLEVMQHQEGDQYGLLQSNDLRDLLTFFARPDNQSFCLVTSRAPLLDLMDYTTYTHRDVDRLSEEDGRTLLRRLGVQGSDTELNKVVADWDGHALTLSILAAYLAERYQGDIKHLSDIPIPTADEPRYERVHRVLRRYDEHLSKDEREFLKLFSVFRLPVQESAFEKVFAPLLKSLDKGAILKLVSRLANYRLIRHDEHEKSYTTHPLIRNHYLTLFTKGDPSQEKAAHEQVKDYYLSIAEDTPQYPTLDDLKPLIEVVHHACQAGAYDEAFSVSDKRIDQHERNVLMWEIGAYETMLSLMLEFFPNNDVRKEPQVIRPSDKSWIINSVGMCLMTLGRLSEAIPVYERANVMDAERQDWHNASITYQNLARLHASLGALEASAEAARQGLDFAHRADNKNDEERATGGYAWILHLLGKTKVAKDFFERSENLEQVMNKSRRYLYSIGGIMHADHLRCTGESDYARRVTEANMQICERNHWFDDASRSHRVLGNLDSDSGNHESARVHYESALKIARSISDRAVLVEALLARGSFLAKHMMDANPAFSDLNEALGYCVESGYRIYEADVRVALAWANLAISNQQSAKAEAERALQMSNEMGYHWGKVDAKEVLKAISG
jgi:tetratricopeptide (TPR) repeat protein